MDEIYYIVGIDARPWQKTPKIGATIPLALLFGAIVAFRQALNQGGPFPDIKGAVATFFLVVFGMLLTKFLKHPWREEYTKNVMLNVVYIGVISTGLYDALAQTQFISGWLDSGVTNIMQCVNSNLELVSEICIGR